MRRVATSRVALHHQQQQSRGASSTTAADQMLQLNLPSGRFYQVGKSRLPSVTTVLSIINKEELQKWERRLVNTALCEELPKDVFSLVSEELAREQADAQNRTLLRERLQISIRKLVEQAWKAPERIRNQASDLGSTTHSLIESLLVEDAAMSASEETIEKVLQEKPEYSSEVERLLRSFSRWCQLHGEGLKLLQTEVPVYNLQCGYAGTVDAIARKIAAPNSLVMLEWKTSNSLKVEYALQVAAYAKAWEEMTNERVEEAWVIRFEKKNRSNDYHRRSVGKDTQDTQRSSSSSSSFSREKTHTFEAVRVRNLDDAFEKFQSALSLWKLFNNAPTTVATNYFQPCKPSLSSSSSSSSSSSPQPPTSSIRRRKTTTKQTQSQSTSDVT